MELLNTEFIKLTGYSHEEIEDLNDWFVKAYPEIDIRAERLNGFSKFTVRDNGTGFNQKFADRLFKVFQRLHSSDKFEGNGIGLALVKRIVHKHGGEVEAFGKPGSGATFSFTIPVETDSE